MFCRCMERRKIIFPPSKKYIKVKTSCAEMRRSRSWWLPRWEWQQKLDGGKRKVYWDFDSISKPFINCYLYKCGNFFLKKILIVNKKVHDPERPYLDKDYNLEDYKKLSVDMVGKVKDLKIVTRGPSIKSITTQPLFRYCITMLSNCQCFYVVCYVLHCLCIINPCIHALFTIKHRIWWNCLIIWMVYCWCAL